jgi:osmotically-inducible protein OsmY
MGRYLPLLLLLILPACRTNVSPEQQVNDLEITTTVKTKLASDVGLSTLPNISVNSTNGVVTLSGQVDTAGQKARAEDIARSTPHVAKVVDNIQVVSKTQ